MRALSVVSTVAAEALARHAATAIISSAWQGVVLFATTAALLRIAPGTTARLRFAIWTTVFFVLAGLPLMSLSGGASHAAEAAAAPLRVDSRWSYALVGLWMMAAAFRSAHLVVQAVRLRRLWRSAVPVPAEVLHGFDLALCKVMICTSAELDRPSVIGFFAPRILIPEWLFRELTPGELQQIVLHETEHLLRRDDWMNLVQKIGLTLFPLSPAMFWIDRQLATERELACDDGVLSRTNAPRAYATCLTSLAERRMAHRRHGRLTALALGALGVIRQSEFSRRIESILSWGTGLSPAMGRAFMAVSVAVALGAAGALAHAPELVAFGLDAPAQVAAAVVAPAPRAEATQAGKAGTEVRIEDVVFRPEVRATKSVMSRQPVKAATRTKAMPVAAAALERAVDPMGQFEQVAQRQAMEQQRRLMLLTNWQESVPVLVTLPDGRTFFATYTATPAQAGWIVFQL